LPASALKSIVRSKKTKGTIGKLFLIPGAPLRHIDDAPRNDLAHSTGIGGPGTLTSRLEEPFQASSRAAGSTAMVSGSKAALGLTKSTMLAIRALLRQSGWIAAGDFIFWLRWFNSLGRNGFL
jgi:hypothetical protein